ncbi:MAG: hypothetical protein FWD73_10520 [Polyangiaceae bacterium]|nr:hypothetical protein [Polyangiaceae bacterium]
MIPACSQGKGDGIVVGTLNVPSCWTGPFNLDPNFFAADPAGSSLQLRIQNGSDFETFSDGISILIYDTSKIRPSSGFAGEYGDALEVGLQPEVTPPGVPVTPDPNPPNISMTMYLQKTCATQNVTLQAVKEVTIPSDGSCDAAAVAGADPTAACDPNTVNVAGVGTGQSLAAFTHVFNGNLDETNAAERLTAGCFDVYFADPREGAAGGLGPPPPCRGHIKGTFRFFFERGRPAQPFP